MNQNNREYNWFVGTYSSRNDTRWYIASSGDQLDEDYETRQTVYLHPDGGIATYCGDGGFYNSQLAAENMMDKYDVTHTFLRLKHFLKTDPRPSLETIGKTYSLLEDDLFEI